MIPAIAILITLSLVALAVCDDADDDLPIDIEEIDPVPPPCDYSPPETAYIRFVPYEITPDYIPPSAFITGDPYPTGLRRYGTSVFISFRLAEAGDFASDLRDKLLPHGIRAYVCDFSMTGESMLERIVDEIDAAALFVVLGTETYGEKTTSICSTRHQLIYAISNHKALFYVRMCDRQHEGVARFLLPQTLSGYHCPDCDNVAPDDLATRIADAARRARFLILSKKPIVQ